MVLAVLFGLILTIVHFFSQRLDIRYTRNRMKNLSFTAGIFITYLFLEFFPLLFQTDFYLTRLSLLFVLIGFGLFHTIQKYEYKHSSRKKLRKDIRNLHSIAFFIYHFVVGIILVNITQVNPIKGILFLIAVFSFTILSSISIKEIHPIVRRRRLVMASLSLSPLLGALLAFFIPITGIFYAILLGFIIGTLLFIVVEESIPREREGEPLYFIFGIIFYTVVIALTWLL